MSTSSIGIGVLRRWGQYEGSIEEATGEDLPHVKKDTGLKNDMFTAKDQ